MSAEHSRVVVGESTLGSKRRYGERTKSPPLRTIDAVTRGTRQTPLLSSALHLVWRWVQSVTCKPRTRGALSPAHPVLVLSCH
eukprot:1487731-Prymnesium_polylepis.1